MLYKNHIEETVKENFDREKPLDNTDKKNLEVVLNVIENITGLKKIHSSQISMIENAIDNLKTDYREYNRDIEKRIESQKGKLKSFQGKTLK